MANRYVGDFLKIYIILLVIITEKIYLGYVCV